MTPKAKTNPKTNNTSAEKVSIEVSKEVAEMLEKLLKDKDMGERGLIALGNQYLKNPLVKGIVKQYIK